MVTPFLQFLLLLWFLASLSFPPSVAFAPEPSGPAERLIQALNLLPDDPSESHSQGVDSEGSQLVERRIHLDVRGKSGIDARDLGQYAGYFKLKDTHASRMFYMFFESRENKAKDPVVLWMSGGPGCSSELALFYENGPFQIANNLTLVWNDYGWDKASSIIFVDQPIGTGFSYTTDVRDMRHDENGVSQDVYNFLQAFFEVHPEFASNGFYVTGESYAGHYVPAVTSRIHQANKAKKGLPINLKGFAIGNGLTNPEIQYKAYADYALEMNLIDQASYNNLSNMYPSCQKAIRSCGTDGTISCATAYVTCQLIFSSLMSLVGEVNYYDIRKKCNGNLCYDFSKMENLLNTQLVKDALGVGDRKFVSCSTLVYKDMLVDWMRNLEVGIPTLLEDGIKLLVYAGDYDLICNWLGNSRWVSAIEWSGKESYASALSESFLVDGEEAGSFTNYGPLTFLKVHDAGHMVPMDQPKAALDMIRHFTKAIPFNDESLVNLMIFYMLSVSHANKAEDPEGLWISGGPSCSSELALFYENGPFQIANNRTLVWNDYGWDKPTGMGLSYTTDVCDIHHGVDTLTYRRNAVEICGMTSLLNTVGERCCRCRRQKVCLMQHTCSEGNSRWVSANVWQRKLYASASSESFLVDGEEAGSSSNYGLLSFLKVLYLIYFDGFTMHDFQSFLSSMSILMLSSS